MFPCVLFTCSNSILFVYFSLLSISFFNLMWFVYFTKFVCLLLVYEEVVFCFLVLFCLFVVIPFCLFTLVCCLSPFLLDVVCLLYKVRLFTSSI